MKIGIFNPYLDTLTGGEKYMLSIASCLSTEHEVFLFWDASKEQEIRQKTKEKLNIDISNVSFISNIFSEETPFIKRYFETKKYDVIIYLSDGSIPLVGCNLLVHFQFPVEWVTNSIKNRIKIHRVKKIICNSEFTKTFIDKKFNINSTLLYPPIFTFSFLPQDKTNLIISVGRLSTSEEGQYFKKQDVLIKIFKTLVDKGVKNWKFVLVVSCSEESAELKNLKSLADGYPMELIVNPTSEKLWNLYTKAKIYWHAAGFQEDLVSHPERAEHFGISTVEAMSAGIVPIVFNGGGQKEIVEHNKNGFLWNTMEELIQYSLSLIKDEKSLRILSKHAVVRASIFTGDRFCREVHQLLI